MGGRLTIRWQQAARVAALGAVGIGALTLLPDALEPPEPPPLPPDVGLGPYASSPAALPAAGERHAGPPRMPNYEPRREPDRPKPDRREGHAPSAKAHREPAHDLPAAPVPPPALPAAVPPASPTPVAVAPSPPAPTPPASTSPTPQPETTGLAREFGFER